MNLPLPSLEAFPRYRRFDPLVPVYRVTPADRPFLHRFYDTSPISPSGRFIALLEFPFEGRPPSPGDEANVVVFDLVDGREIFSTPTACWDVQVGAHVQWGGSDAELFFNRIDRSDWTPYGVKLDIFEKHEQRLRGTVYMVTPDGRTVASPNLARIGMAQPGYGVILPADRITANRGAPSDDGVFVTDTATGDVHLLISFAELYAQFGDRMGGIDLSSGGFYGFHVKWNPQATRLMFIARWMKDGAKKNHSLNFLFTMNADGSNVRMALDGSRWKGGHHPNWCPDGDHIVMNLVFDRGGLLPSRLFSFAERAARKIGIGYHSNRRPLRFARFRHDGTDLTVLAGNVFGSGHPTMTPDDAEILTDCYPGERVAFGDGTVPLRLVNVTSGDETCLVRIKTAPPIPGPEQELRIDPHPAWDRSGARFVFNACPDGIRQVFVADFSQTTEAA